MFYVYILYSRKLNKFYIGYTKDLKSRFKKHNNGNVSYTSKGVPWILVYYQAFVEKLDAINEEKFLKTGKGREEVVKALEDLNNDLAAAVVELKRKKGN